MADGGRRHERKPSDQPAAIQKGSETYDGTVTDISDSGAAIDFALPGGTSKLKFDVGEQINVESRSLHEKEGRVVRHSDGGFALNFDGFKTD
ncbi:MAG: PilZ domain-containing protein [Rhodospirillaceae bacterium]|nr:PilZ domain-containing protein [Rhodospirillaceae bacterium]